MMRTRAEVYGAISIVNAIATGRGATMGVALKTTCTLDVMPGTGIQVKSGMRSLSSRLVETTVRRIVAKRDLAKYRLRVHLESEVPSGYGLKSSSAISLAVAMACSHSLHPGMSDRAILLASAEASIAARVSITGAYDDACACYYGGITITDNAARRLVRRQAAPQGLAVAILIPRSRRRGDPAALRSLRAPMREAWDLSREHGDHWNAMTLNGLAAAPVLGPEPSEIASIIEAGALGASVSGNGPAVAAVARPADLDAVCKALSSIGGRVVRTTPNRQAARCSIL
ncbi:MAG: shikimate kinase [Thaumarchaeota archaeon]|nr:shikimate kinase [Nitrososphaerota archaeon]MDD9814020.1 shikimate kinase [Nitrososphaerota archaeon]MDD9825861.1 shikimate kinase [Nitrososphaerota archaeon]MDD9842566.1 shikimate kinase [Nitrososphaerota archaeon]